MATRLSIVYKRQEEIRLLIGNTLASLRGQTPNAGGNSVPPKAMCLETVLSEMERVSSESLEMATELRDRLGEIG